MTAEKRILTLHPEGKKGVSILKRRYLIIKDFILSVVQEKGEITYQDLNSHAILELSKTFDGKVAWYVVTVKLDLEARNILERIPKTSPHRLRLKQKK